METLGTIIGVAMVFIGAALIVGGWFAYKVLKTAYGRATEPKPRKRLDIRV